MLDLFYIGFVVVFLGLGVALARYFTELAHG